MNQMFYGCKELETLKLTNFDMSKVTTNTSDMLQGCVKLTHFYTPRTTKTINLPTTLYNATDPLDEDAYTQIKTGDFEGESAHLAKALDINYYPNGATGSVVVQKKPLSGTIFIKDNPFTPAPGKSFKNWTTSSNGSGTKYNAMQTYSTDASLNLYAQWETAVFNVVYKDRGTIVKADKVNYGESSTPPHIEREGYDLSWDKSTSNITQDLEINAVWTLKQNNVYYIDYYKENISKTGFELDLAETVTKYANPGTKVNANYSDRKEIEGFLFDSTNGNNVMTGTVGQNGSTLHLKLYYTRRTYIKKIEDDDGNEIATVTGNYGEEIPLPTDITKEGYEFEGWQDENGNIIETIKIEDIRDGNPIPIWTRNENAFYIKSTKYSIVGGEKVIVKVSPNTTVNSFKNNIETNGTMNVLNERNSTIGQSELVKTDYILQVKHDGKTYNYTIVVKGDINKDGKLTLADVSLMNQAIVKKITLNTTRKRAADINYDGNVSLIDLSLANQFIVKKISL